MRHKNDELYGKIIEFVNDYFEETGHSPSTREIEQGVGVPRPTVQRYLKSLQERGEIEYDGHRSIVTSYMREMRNTTRMQMGNSIPCGPLDDVVDAELEHIRMPLALTGSGDFFLLRARGESMINAGIDDGDLVMQGTPREIFVQVDKLKEFGLDVPQVTEVTYLLRKEGIDLPADILTIEEMVGAVCQLK